ncbi:MAG: NADP-dependent phosphogluconate dehydrogenase [Candidatus Dojkabacteria bacterium]
MKIGLIGLGSMGYALMGNLLDNGHEVVAWNRSQEKRDKARAETNAEVVETVGELVEKLDNPKIIFSIISAGEPIDQLLFGTEGVDGLAEMLNGDDIFVDLANSHYKDSVRRAEQLAEKGITMLDVGISGGVDGARSGACCMVGGNSRAFELLEPIFRDITVVNGYGYFGGNGAGHYVKMVHNGIEYGMMQAIAEGVSMVHHKQDYEVDVEKLLGVWNSGSIIQSRLVGFLKQAYEQDPGLEKERAEVGSLGTGRWTVEEALREGIPVPNIANAVFARYNSRFENFHGWKVVQAMRRVFGAHSSSDRG